MKNVHWFSGLLLALTISAISSLPQAEGATNGEVRITPLVHASVRIDFSGSVIYVDPWGVIDLQDMPAADLILITDDSGHHLDAEAVQHLSQSHTTVITPESGLAQLADAVRLDNGERHDLGSLSIEAVAAYDIIPGAPEHPKGKANGYVATLGEQRLYFAGVTECVPEVAALSDIDVAFMPMNIPVGRMTPEATAECLRIIEPGLAYIYHYDQSYALEASGSTFEGWELPGGLTVAESVARLEQLMSGSGIELVTEGFYPDLNPGQ